MALVERWNTTWKPLGQAVTYTLVIKEEGYGGGASSITNLDTDPLSVRNRGVDIFSIGAIIGTEIEFRFNITTDDGTDYDDLLIATERQFLIEIERDSVSFFIGFLKPENISKTVYDRGYLLSLSASDGLSYLKEVPFRDSNNDNYTDRVNFLTIIKRVLTFTGHSLDITVKLGTHHLTGALMTAIECALDKVSNNSERFYRSEDGILEPSTCEEVLIQQIGIWNCSIRQLNGTWYIYNNVEINSFLFTFDWATLTQQSRVSHNPIVVIDNYEFTTKGQVSYRPPLSNVAITFENKFVPVNVITNGDFSSGTANWTNGGGVNAWDTFAVSGEILTCRETSTLDDDKEFISDSFELTELTSSDRLVLSISALLDFWTTGSPRGLTPNLSVEITGPEGSVIIHLGKLSEQWTDYGGNNPLMLGTGNYTIKIIVQNDSFINDIQVKFDNIFMYVDYGEAAVTVDKLITISNDNAVDDLKEEYLTKIGDSAEANDQGALKIGNTLTTLWRTFGKTEDEPIVDLLGAFQLDARQDFTKYLRLEIIDLDDNINTGTIIVLDSKNYRTIRFNKVYRSMILDIDILEINS